MAARATNHSSKSDTSESIVLTSPSKNALEIGLPYRHSSSQQPAFTPTFELRDDPLQRLSSSSTPKASPTDQRPPSLAKIDVNLAQIGKRRSINEGSKRPTSPHVTIATPTSARHSQSLASQDRRASVPALHSPTPHPGNGSVPSTSRSQSSFGSPRRQSSLGKAAAYAAQSLIDAVSGRSTPHSAGPRPDSASAINRRNVTSPDNVSGEHQYATYPAVFDEMGDDEQDKGHGSRRQSSGRWTPTILSGIRWKPGSPANTLQQSAAGKQISPRFQVVHTEPDQLTEDEKEQLGSSGQGRRTPAQYRPKEDVAGTKLGLSLNQHPSNTQSTSQPYRNTHPLSHAHKMSTASSTASNSSHSIQMQSPRLATHSRNQSLQYTSPTMSTSHSRHTSMHTSGLQISPVLQASSLGNGHTSPLIIPQARRGAINLRPASKKKKAALARRKRAAALAIEAQRKPLRQQVSELLFMMISALLHPSSTVQSCQMHLKTTIKNIDMSFRDRRTGVRVWRPSWLGAYIPLLIWLVVSLSSTFTVLIWHTQVFRALDRLSTTLQDLGLKGRLTLGSLIFLTTFPPLPLYSTLIILCGFSFGLLQGFIISYIAALLGAIVVFLLSRSLLKGWMVELLNKSGGLKRVVRAIEKRPKLLFLVRLAPYPYNLMNTLLASSPTLTLRTYTLCTALALPKLLVHCALGTSIKNFAAYNGAGSNKSKTPPLNNDTIDNGNGSTDALPTIGGDDTTIEDATASHTAETIKHIFGFVGLGLCIGIFIYLFSVARKAVDEELDDDENLLEDYDIILSDEDDDDEGDEGEGEEEEEEGSELDLDDHNIARGSSESGSPIQQKRLSSLSAQSDRFNSIDSNQMLDQRKFVPGADGVTPNFTASSRHYNESNPYFTHSLCSSTKYTTNRPNRHMESQVSLADSIVEMEKHAVEMEKEPLLFQQAGNQSDLSSSNTSHRSYHDDEGGTKGGWKG